MDQSRYQGSNNISSFFPKHPLQSATAYDDDVTDSRQATPAKTSSGFLKQRKQAVFKHLSSHHSKNNTIENNYYVQE